jgi:hypothetical protein
LKTILPRVGGFRNRGLSRRKQMWDFAKLNTKERQKDRLRKDKKELKPYA